ncbi:MAG: hypothetical protein ACP5O1_04750 [Phycisphaerae bacterium]
MATSRQEFKAFLADFKGGLLGRWFVNGTPTRATDGQNGIRDPEIPILKLSRFQLLNQYRLILRGYYHTITVILAAVVFAAFVDLAPPMYSCWPLTMYL